MAKKSGTNGPYAYISNSASSSVTVIDTSNPSNSTVVVPAIRVGSNPAGLTLTPHPREDFLYVANANSASPSVSVIDTRTLQKACPNIDVGHGVGLLPTSMAVSNDGNTVYTGLMYPDNENTFRMRDAVCAISTINNKVIALIDISFGGMPVNNQWPSSKGGCGGIGTLAMRPGHPELYVPIGYANKVAVIDTNSNCVIRTFSTGSGPGLAFASNGNQFYEVCTYNRGFAVFDADGSFVTNNPLVTDTPEVLAVSPDSRWVYVLCVDSSTVAVIDTANPGGKVINIQMPFRPSALAFTPDSAYAYVAGGGDDAMLSVINTNLPTAKGALIPLPDGGPDGIVIGTKTH